MFLAAKEKQQNIIYRSLVTLVVTAFIGTSVIPPQRSYAQALNLPQPGSMVKITNDFQPAVITGIKIDPNNPLLFDFLIDPGQVPLNDTQRNIEYKKLIKYFLAALTTPEHDMWVNLSPYEHHRMIADDLSKTEMGRDMLAQDYVLKQLSASLIYPEESLGKKFWDAVYERVRMETGSAQIPVNTFNKVWILPDKASIFEKGNVAMVVSSHMRVLMDQDYLSLNKHANADKNVSHATSDVMREIVLPAIEKEVNEGKNFANIRQIYNSIILASWFKQRIKMHLLSKIYVNKNENAGVELKTPQDNDRIYKNYLRAFKLGAFNYIKEDLDPVSGETLPRKYFSGGESYAMMANKIGTRSAILTITNNPGSLAMKAFVNVRVLLAVLGASVALSGSAAFGGTASSSSALPTATSISQQIADIQNEMSSLRLHISEENHGAQNFQRIKDVKELGVLAVKVLNLKAQEAASTPTSVTPATGGEQTSSVPIVTPNSSTVPVTSADQTATHHFLDNPTTVKQNSTITVTGPNPVTYTHVVGANYVAPHHQGGIDFYTSGDHDSVNSHHLSTDDLSHVIVHPETGWQSFVSGFKTTFIVDNPTNAPIGATIVVKKNNQIIVTGTLAAVGNTYDKQEIALVNLAGHSGGFYSPEDGYTFSTVGQGQPATASSTSTTSTVASVQPASADDLKTTAEVKAHPLNASDLTITVVSTNGTTRVITHAFDPTPTTNGDMEVFSYNHGSFNTSYISAQDWQNHITIHETGFLGGLFSKFPFLVENDLTNNQVGNIVVIYKSVKHGNGVEKEIARGIVAGQVETETGRLGLALVKSSNIPQSVSGFYEFTGDDIIYVPAGSPMPQDLTETIINPNLLPLHKIITPIKGVPDQNQKNAITAELAKLSTVPQAVTNWVNKYFVATNRHDAREVKYQLIEALRTIILTPPDLTGPASPQALSTLIDQNSPARVSYSDNGRTNTFSYVESAYTNLDGSLVLNTAPHFWHRDNITTVLIPSNAVPSVIVQPPSFFTEFKTGFDWPSVTGVQSSLVGHQVGIYDANANEILRGTYVADAEVPFGFDGTSWGYVIDGLTGKHHSQYEPGEGRRIEAEPIGVDLPPGPTHLAFKKDFWPLARILYPTGKDVKPLNGKPNDDQKTQLQAVLDTLAGNAPPELIVSINSLMNATSRYAARQAISDITSFQGLYEIVPNKESTSFAPVIPPTQTPVTPEITKLTAGVTYPMNLGTIQLPDRSIGNVVNYSLDPNGPYVLVNSVDTQSGTFHSMPYYLTDEVPLDQWPAAKLTDTHPANDAFQVPEIDPNLPKLNVNDDIWVYPTKDQSAFKGRVVKIFMEHGQYYVHALDHLNRTHKIPLTAGSYRKSLLTDPPTDTVDDHTSPTLQLSAASNTSTNLGEALTTGGESDVTSLTNTVTAWSTLNFELDGSSIKRVMYVKPDNRDLSKAKSVVVHSVIGGFWSRAFGPLELESHIIPIDVWNAGVTQVKPNWFKSIFHDNDVDELPLYGTIYGQDPQGYPNVHRGKQFKYFDNTKSGHGDVVVQGEIYRITSDGDNVRVHVKSPDGKDGWVVLDETSAYSYLVGDNLDDLKRNPIIARYPGMVLTPGKTPGSVHLGYASQPVNTTIATPAVNPESIVFPLKKKQWVSIDGGAPVQVIKQYRNEVTKKGVVQIVFDAWVKGITVGPNELARVKYTVPPSSIKIVPAPAPVLASGASVPAINITGFVFNPDVQAAIDKFNVFANGNPQVTPDDIMQLNQALNNYQTAINQKNIGKISPKRLKRFHDGVMKLFEEKTSVGGIDFDAKYLQLNLQGDATNIPVPQGFQWLLNTPIRGFNPKIIDIHSGIGYTLSFFKGLLTPGQEQSAKADLPKPMAVDHRLAMKNWAAEEV